MKMKLTTSPFKSDVLTLTKSELKRISEGEELHVSALYIRLEEEPKPDVVRWVWATTKIGEADFEDFEKSPNLKLTIDGATGKLKSAEVL